MLYGEVRATSMCECDLSTPTRSDLSGYFTEKDTKFLNPKGQETHLNLSWDAGVQAMQHRNVKHMTAHGQSRAGGVGLLS